MNTTHPAENPLKKEDIMKMMKRTLSILLTIVVGIVLLTSCGQSGSSQPAVSAGGASAGDTQSASDKGEPTKVVLPCRRSMSYRPQKRFRLLRTK